MTENEIAREVVDSSYKIHTLFGPGLLESVYEAILVAELQKRGLRVVHQQAIPVVYEHIELNQNARDADNGVSRATVREGVNAATDALPHGRATDITPSDCPTLIWFDLEIGFRADLIVESRVIVEIKSVEQPTPVHKKQLLTYLRLADKRLGLLINFNTAFIRDGIVRVVNQLKEKFIRQQEPHAKPQSRKDNAKKKIPLSRAAIVNHKPMNPCSFRAGIKIATL